MYYWKWWQVILWIILSIIVILGVVWLALFIVNLLTGGKLFDDVFAIVVALG